MTKQVWLVKQEPETYAWETFVHDERTVWEGVRNYQARNNLKSMKSGDRVLFYHSGSDKAVVGIAEVVRSAFPDPSANSDEGWVAVELKPVKSLPRPVTLQQIKAKPRLAQTGLVRHTRLSVMPLTAAEYALIVELGGG